MSVLYSDKALDNLFANAPEVTVYYDPADMGNSVLVVGMQLYHLGKLVFILFSIVWLAGFLPQV
ncbi:hypothetical protein BTA51_14125 [Hahella sp. CCB-MM4]|nr:hypothetical protein BTA51_14125 [Hahella sp. CCB-MM4]